jgi:uncharacterized protein YjiS (DUF1127 family)
MSKMYNPSLFTAERHAAPHVPQAGFWATLAVPFTALAREIRARHDAHWLAALDDRGLSDIGLTRGGIDHVVRHGRRPPAAQPGGIAQTSRPASLPASAWTEWR